MIPAPHYLRPSKSVLLRKSFAFRYVFLPSAIVILLWSIRSLASSSRPLRHFPPSSHPPSNYSEEDLDNLRPHFLPRPPAWVDAAEQVKQAFLHAYHGYEDFASPNDELLPTSRKGVDNFNGWGLTIYDSLDTMLLMNLTDEFQRAVSIISRADFSVPPVRKFSFIDLTLCLYVLPNLRLIIVVSLLPTLEKDKPAPFFETVIRYLGGMLSAYALSNNPVLLEKAEQLGHLLSPAFETESGLPYFSVNAVRHVTGVSLPHPHGFLAEIASCQPEYTYLAKLTGNRTYYERVDKIMKTLEHAPTEKLGGMLPTHWKLDIGRPIDRKLSMGGQADSAHEYLLKQYLLTGRTDKAALEMYLRTATHVLTHMLYVSPHRNILYPVVTYGEPPHDVATHHFEHLACFIPGLFALAAHVLPLDNLTSLGIDFTALADDLSPESQRDYERLSHYSLADVHRWAAEGLTESCAVLYADQPTGMSPDEVLMRTKPMPEMWIDKLDQWRMGGRRGKPPGTGIIQPKPHVPGQKKGEKDYDVHKPAYKLRPETIESLYILWRTTGEERWREYGWNIFQAIEQLSKTDVGYASVWHVENLPVHKKDSMPRQWFFYQSHAAFISCVVTLVLNSYFLAETLKYLYLLFTDEDLIPFEKWVLNTEAHPFPIFNWSDQEKKEFGIA